VTAGNVAVAARDRASGRLKRPLSPRVSRTPGSERDRREKRPPARLCATRMRSRLWHDACDARLQERSVPREVTPSWHNVERREEEVMNVISRTVGALSVAALLAAGNPAGTSASNEPPLDINSASVAELTALPGIGPAKAAAIVAERQQEPFRSVADLTRVKGIGERTLEELGPRITVGEAGKNEAASN
jgi:competence protein ComEA